MGWQFADTIKFYVREPFAWRLRVPGPFMKHLCCGCYYREALRDLHPSIVVLCFRGPVADDTAGRQIVRNRFCAKNEAAPPDVADQRGLIRRVDIATQPTHVNVDQVRVRNKFVVPDIFQEGGSCQQFAAPPHHVLEQLEFSWPQVDPTAVTRRGSIDEVELQRPHAQHRFIGKSGPPDEGELRSISIQRLRAAVFWDRRGAGAILASGPRPSQVCSTAANEYRHIQRRRLIAIPRERPERGSAPGQEGHRYRPESPPLHLAPLAVPAYLGQPGDAACPCSTNSAAALISAAKLLNRGQRVLARADRPWRYWY